MGIQILRRGLNDLMRCRVRGEVSINPTRTNQDAQRARSQVLVGSSDLGRGVMGHSARGAEGLKDRTDDGRGTHDACRRLNSPGNGLATAFLHPLTAGLTISTLFCPSSSFSSHPPPSRPFLLSHGLFLTGIKSLLTLDPSTSFSNLQLCHLTNPSLFTNTLLAPALPSGQ